MRKSGPYDTLAAAAQATREAGTQRELLAQLHRAIAESARLAAVLYRLQGRTPHAPKYGHVYAALKDVEVRVETMIRRSHDDDTP